MTLSPELAEKLLFRVIADSDIPMEELEQIIRAYPEAVNYISPKGATPLALAVKNNLNDRVEWLLKHGADPNAGVPPPIFWAMECLSEKDFPPTVMLLAKHGADLNIADPRTGQVPLALAIEKSQDLSFLRSMMEAGADPNQGYPCTKHRDVKPPLYWALQSSKAEELLDLMQEFGADVPKFLATPYMVDKLLATNKPALVRKLLAMAKDQGGVDLVSPYDDYNTWFSACLRNSYYSGCPLHQLLPDLLDAGADPTCAGPENSSPRIFLKEGVEEMKVDAKENEETLRRWVAHPKVSEEEAQHAFHTALNKQKWSFARVLAESEKVDINQEFSCGRDTCTPLTHALANKQPAWAEWLLEHGAIFSPENFDAVMEKRAGFYLDPRDASTQEYCRVILQHKLYTPHSVLFLAKSSEDLPPTVLNEIRDAEVDLTLLLNDRTTECDRPSLLAFALQQGASPTVERAQELLCKAASQGHADIMRAFIAQGADIYQRGSKGNTLAMVAVMNGHPAVAGALAEANLAFAHAARNDKGQTLRDVALAKYGSLSAFPPELQCIAARPLHIAESGVDREPSRIEQAISLLARAISEDPHQLDARFGDVNDRVECMISGTLAKPFAAAIAQLLSNRGDVDVSVDTTEHRQWVRFPIPETVPDEQRVINACNAARENPGWLAAFRSLPKMKGLQWGETLFLVIDAPGASGLTTAVLTTAADAKERLQVNGETAITPLPGIRLQEKPACVVTVQSAVSQEQPEQKAAGAGGVNRPQR